MKRNIVISSALTMGILLLGSSTAVYAAGIDYNEMSYEDAIQQPGYDPSVNNTGTPYADELVEEGPDGENNVDEVVVKTNELSNEQNVVDKLDAGEWDLKGTYTFYTQSLVMTSGGGDVRIDYVFQIPYAKFKN